MVESRPEALPHAQRTVGQLVAESIRFYGDHFWHVVVLGLVFVAIDIASWSERPVSVQVVTLYAFAPFLTAAYVRASMLVTGGAWSWQALVAGIAVFLPFPALLLIYALPGVVWLALFGLAVPAAVAERLGAVAALRRGWRLGRADAIHAIGGLATFVILYFICRYALDVLLASQGDQTEAIAIILADLVLSPLLFVGPALLYLDQAARVE